MNVDLGNDLADLKARLKAIEDLKPADRLGKLERFQTGVTWGLAVISALLGFLADTIKKKLGL